MPILYSNFASAYLSAPLGGTDQDTQVVLTPGTGQLFPDPLNPDDFFVVVLEDVNGTKEICKCTSRIADTLTVERGQEETEIVAFPANSVCELRLTRDSLKVTPIDGQVTSIQINNTEILGDVPDTLLPGELFVDLVGHTLWIGNSIGDPVLLIDRMHIDVDANPPTLPQETQLWYVTDLNTMRVYDGSVWQNISEDKIPRVYSAPQGDIAVFDAFGNVQPNGSLNTELSNKVDKMSPTVAGNAVRQIGNGNIEDAGYPALSIPNAYINIAGGTQVATPDNNDLFTIYRPSLGGNRTISREVFLQGISGVLGSLIHIDRLTFSSSEIHILSNILNGFDTYLLLFEHVDGTNDVRMQVSENNGGNWESGPYSFGYDTSIATATTSFIGIAEDMRINGSITGALWMYLQNTTAQTLFENNLIKNSSGPVDLNNRRYAGMGVYSGGTVNALRIYLSLGGILSGAIDVYGLAR